MEKYQECFSDWSDVKKQFEIEDAEPEEVLLALYDRDGYEGVAVVVYREGETYYYQESSHCSCYGLEDTWEPESYDLPTFIGYLERIESRGYVPEYHKSKLSLLPLLRERLEQKQGSALGRIVQTLGPEN